MNLHSGMAFLVLLAGFLLLDMSTVVAQRPQVIPATRQNTSRETLSEVAMNMKPAPSGRPPFAIPNKFKIDPKNAAGIDGGADPVVQLSGGTLAPSEFVNFEGASDDDNSAILGFRVVPPDTEGDVGPNHYVQWINLISEIFDKSGNTVLGPFAGNAYFSGMGGDCESDNSGDPIVLYDEQADRWLVSQFAVRAAPYSMCIAISTTPDPTGTYHRYEFDFGLDFPDYPKLGIWGDSYVMTTRDFSSGQFWAGMSAVAMDRTAMLAGVPTSMVRFPNSFGNSKDGYLPADSDGPVSGPAIFGGHGADFNTTFELWELDVDWSNPGAASFTSIPGVTISPYDGVVPSANQPNGQTLDDLSFFTMHRLNVRDFGSHVAMVANHTVEASPGTAGIRWYEFRNTGGNWTLYQEGTYSPDTDDRWMGSIAINAAGEIALGFSVSSSSRFPSIYVTGQTASSSGTGVMDIAETAIIDGAGAQSGASRWGDYSKMSVDPSDDRTFWYTNEYYATTGSFDFKTRIAAFRISPIPVETTVFLEGPYTGGGQMSTLLNAHLPSAQPFQGSPWLYSGTETISSVPADAVDWLLLELRSESAPVSMIARQAVLLLSDGSVVDTSGVNSPRFSGLSSDSVYVVLWSRNHLPVMSNKKVGLIADLVTYDFTSSNGSGYSAGGTPLKDLGDGRFGLFSGDADADGLLNSVDFYGYLGQTSVGASGYESADFNLDGSVDALDFSLFIANSRAGASSQVP